MYRDIKHGQPYHGHGQGQGQMNIIKSAGSELTMTEVSMGNKRSVSTKHT